jgi:hypothetical protein
MGWRALGKADTIFCHIQIQTNEKQRKSSSILNVIENYFKQALRFNAENP